MSSRTFRQHFDLPHETEDLSVAEAVRDQPLSSQRYPCANRSSVGLHMTDIIGPVHLHQEAIRVIELERFL
jgi:hypothetical protein